MLAFDRTTRPVLTFHEASSLEDPSRAQALAVARINALQPSWDATDIGRALIDAIAAIEDVADNSERAGQMRRIVLISDLQQGSRLEALGEFEWPKDVELEVKTISDDSSNAGLQRLADPVDAGTTANLGSASSTTPPRAASGSTCNGPARRAAGSAIRSMPTSRPVRAGSSACPGSRATPRHSPSS